MALTLGQAAKAAKVSKTAVAQALVTGRLSATKDDLGRWQIEPAELHRVYPLRSKEVDESEYLVDTDQGAEIARLKATVEGLERLCRQIEGERDSLRDQNIRLTALLPPPQPPQEQPRRRWWWWKGTGGAR